MLRSVSACGTARGASRAGCLATCRLAGLGRPGDQHVEPDAHRGVEEQMLEHPNGPRSRRKAEPAPLQVRQRGGRRLPPPSPPTYYFFLPAPFFVASTATYP